VKKRRLEGDAGEHKRKRKRNRRERETDNERERPGRKEEENRVPLLSLALSLGVSLSLSLSDYLLFLITASSLQIIQSEGGQFTLSDDSHSPSDVSMHYKKLLQYLISMQIDTIYYLDGPQKPKSEIKAGEIRNVRDHSFWKNFHLEW
jgi:hypothetical protein